MPPPEATTPAGEQDEDDYMNMAFTEPQNTIPETSIARRARLKREAEARSRPKSKAEREADSAAAREAALATSIDSSNKGFKMMQKLGFKGGALGKTEDGEGSDRRTEPIELVMKEGRGGVGLDGEKKRKFREEVQGVEKKARVEEGEYRERLMREREVKRLEGQVIGAMKVAEKLDEEDEGGVVDGGAVKSDEGAEAVEDGPTETKAVPAQSKPLHKVNVLWRANVKHRVEAERERRMRYDLYQSLSRQPTYDDPDEDNIDRQALGKEEEDIEEEDPELDEFLALEPEVRLQKLVGYLRERFHYCFWCKYRYADADMEGCPGVTEEDHD